MRKLTFSLLLPMVVMGSVACHDDEDDDGAASMAPRRLVEQIKPPLDVKKPPEGARKTASGLVYTKLTANEAGVQPTAHDTALVQYTGWRQRTGDTFFTTKGRGEPIAIDLATAAPGFAETLGLMHKGERAMVWVPSSPGTTEPLVYEVEVIDVIAPPKVANRTAAETGAKGAKSDNVGKDENAGDLKTKAAAVSPGVSSSH
jgi:hypothetical protein